MANDRRYRVLTWDADLRAFTPQGGLDMPHDNLTRWELRRYLAKLRQCGYSVHRTHGDSDPYVLVERVDGHG